MAIHAHLTRGLTPDDVTPQDVEDLRLAKRALRPGSPTEAVLADLLLGLCALASLSGELVVDIHREEASHE